MKPHQVEWSRSETVVAVEQLDALLDQLHLEAVGQAPILVSIGGPAGCLIVGLGRAESVLSFISSDSEPPYLVSTNRSKDEAEVEYFMNGHHSPVQAKHVIPMDLARDAVRVFVEHGALLASVRWSEL